MDIKALQLCSRFSYTPNKLGFCGLSSANKVFKECILNNKCDKVEMELSHFKALYPYLQTIEQVTGKPMFSYEAVKAYWLGNDLLKQFKSEHYQILIDNLQKKGLPDFFIDKIAKKKPKVFIPFHLFNILHIGVGQITGSVPFNLSSINNCMIRWGKIKLKVKREKLKVDLYSLEKSSSRYKLVKKEEMVKFDPIMVGDLKISDEVLVHWGWVVEKVKSEKLKVKSLKQWTEYLIKSL
jgi:hypothetical protein